jgi:hypothetical protein
MLCEHTEMQSCCKCFHLRKRSVQTLCAIYIEGGVQGPNADSTGVAQRNGCTLEDMQENLRCLVDLQVRTLCAYMCRADLEVQERPTCSVRMAESHRCCYDWCTVAHDRHP